MRRQLFLLSICLSLGCASTDTIVLDDTKRPATARVDVYRHGDAVIKQHRPVQEYTWFGPAKDEGRASKVFIKRAKKAGADGVILGEPENRGMQWSGFGAEQKYTFRAVAIVYEPKQWIRSGSSLE